MFKEFSIGDNIYLHQTYHMAKYYKEDFGSYFKGTIVKKTKQQLHIDIDGTTYRFVEGWGKGTLASYKDFVIKTERASTRVYDFSSLRIEKATKRLDKKYKKFFTDTIETYPNLSEKLEVHYNGVYGTVMTVNDGNLAGIPIFQPEGIRTKKHSEIITHEKIANGIVVLGQHTKDHMYHI